MSDWDSVNRCWVCGAAFGHTCPNEPHTADEYLDAARQEAVALVVDLADGRPSTLLRVALSEARYLKANERLGRR